MPEEIQTNDELTDKINAALEAEPDVVTPEVTETETPEILSEEVETPAVETPEQPSPEPTEPDYKQKFVESSRESILNAERVKVRDAQLEKLTKKDTPTDEAMRELYPDWDNYDDFTKKIVIKTEAQEMRQHRIDSELSEFREEKKLKAELNSVIAGTPQLVGKESEFKKFAANPKNKGISAEVLAKAFLFDVEVPAPEVPKTEGLPQGNGGSREPFKTKKVSIEEAAQIRKTDNNRYMELVKSGMIDDDLE